VIRILIDGRRADTRISLAQDNGHWKATFAVALGDEVITTLVADGGSAPYVLMQLAEMIEAVLPGIRRVVISR
jgi:hypothetical protein